MSFVERPAGQSKVGVAQGIEPKAPAARRVVSYRSIAPIAMLCDVAIIVAMGVLAAAIYNFAVFGRTGNLVQHGAHAAIVAALFVFLAHQREMYEPRELLNFQSQLRRIPWKWFGVFLFLSAVAFSMKSGESLSRGETISFSFLGLAGLIGLRLFWRLFLADSLTAQRLAGRKIVLLTDLSSANNSGLFDTLARHGMQPTRQFVLPVGTETINQRREILSQAIAAIRGSDIEEVVIGADIKYWPELSDMVSELRILPLPVNFVPVGTAAEILKLPSHTIGDSIAIELQQRPLNLGERAVKRFLDIAIAAPALIMLLPLLFITALAIKLDSPGPILFRQRRCGFNGRTFQILKFRTMSVLEDGDVVAQATRDDCRVTRIGAWLRKSSIDELPQLLNVLQGHMSLIGPRPHALAHDNQFDKTVSKYAFRHHVKPGLTGWAQVNGFRGQTKTVEDIEQRVQLDLWYIDNWSLSLDFKILLMTIFEVMRGENAY